MRKLKIILCLLTVLAAIAFVGVHLYSQLVLDSTAPVITISEDTVVVSVNDKEEALLEGVSAYDNRDGDLTNEIMVSGVSQLIGSNIAKVNYIVFDHSDNMATASRTVCYSDYESPHFSLLSPLVYNVGERISLIGRVVVKDVLDGNISGSIRLSSIALNNTVEGIYHVALRVTNSMGDSSTVTLPIIIQSKKASSSEIELEKYLIYLKTGESFDPEDYFKSLTLSGGGRGSYATLNVDNEVDTSTAGTYEVTYSYTDSSMTVTQAILTVVVEEGEVLS